MKNHPEITAELRDLYLLKELSPEDFTRVLETAHVKYLEKGVNLFNQGEPATAFFLLRKGQIKLYRLSPSGHEKIIEIIKPGQTFAEAVMFMEHHAYPVNSEALEESEVVSIASRVFLGVLRHSMDTCFRLMAAMSMRLRARVAEIDNLCLHDATFRLADYLLEEAEQASHIMLRVPKSVLASRLSIQNETLSRILKRLRTAGIIEVHGKEITVLNIEALRRLMGA